MPDIPIFFQVIAGLVATVGTLLAAWRGLRWMVKTADRITIVLEGLYDEFKPNGGNSVKDHLAAQTRLLNEVLEVQATQVEQGEEIKAGVTKGAERNAQQIVSSIERNDP